MSPAKRVADCVLALCIAPLAILIVLIVGMLSAGHFRAWPFFTQERRGRHERTIRVFKIRSLPKDFPADVGKHDIDQESFSRFSSWLRKSHVDELPQLLNVLTGSMSLVGPRPMIDDVLDLLEPADREVRHLARPGLTGLWQISTAGSVSLHECPELDSWYAAEASAWTDVRILWWTFLSVLGRSALNSGRLLERLSS